MNDTDLYKFSPILAAILPAAIFTTQAAKERDIQYVMMGTKFEIYAIVIFRIFSA